MADLLRKDAVLVAHKGDRLEITYFSDFCCYGMKAEGIRVISRKQKVKSVIGTDLWHANS